MLSHRNWEAALTEVAVVPEVPDSHWRIIIWITESVQLGFLIWLKLAIRNVDD